MRLGKSRAGATALILPSRNDQTPNTKHHRTARLAQPLLARVPALSSLPSAGARFYCPCTPAAPALRSPWSRTNVSSPGHRDNHVRAATMMKKPSALDPRDSRSPFSFSLSTANRATSLPTQTNPAIRHGKQLAESLTKTLKTRRDSIEPKASAKRPHHNVFNPDGKVGFFPPFSVCPLQTLRAAATMPSLNAHPP